MPDIRPRLGDRVVDRRNGRSGTFNGWRQLMGRCCAFVLGADHRPFFVPAEFVDKPLTARTMHAKKNWPSYRKAGR